MSRNRSFALVGLALATFFASADRVAAQTLSTLWANTAAPIIADSGPDSAVELGVKFRSDSAGKVTGIRFFKGAGNTGTHVGNLWTSTGTLLASATFANETASGWQQVAFSSSVAITANTVYVASYHTNVGHYSADQGFFSGKGMDSPPLHALADGVSGADGVYAYGQNSTFPGNGYLSSNYWVDVLVDAGPAATLTSITVTPANATISTGATQQFAARGTYSDGSTLNLTSQVGWASSSTTVATINGAGLATAAAAGNTIISATVGSVSGSTALAVQTAPPSTTFTLWPSTTVPPLADAGPDSAVELGVKFRADSSGFVTGIRFYKSTANTGTHVGNLWSSSGTRLATATFSGETASGWQQVSFSTPIAITANSVYVASYHTTVGHYADTLNYFATTGVDSPPLHALANGVSGVNGVYAYGATSAFPSLGFQSSNYWVDVVVNSTPPATLSSIAVSPANASVQAGTALQLTATGTYSDGSTKALTGTSTWTSSATGVATVSAAGLVTAANTGTTTISASLGGITGSTSLTVTPGPLTITTASLPGGTQFAAYSATLAATGGTPPYSWSIPAGLPPGLTLNSTTGAIAGTPTTVGAFSFTTQASDSAGNTSSVMLAITITSTAPSNHTIWPSTATPALADAGPDSAVELGVKFRADVNGSVTGIRFYKSTANSGTHVGNLWSSNGTRLATATFAGETASGWQQVNFATPIAITANTVYVASYHTNVGHYAATLNYFATVGVDSPPLHALANGVSGPDGAFAYGASSVFPSNGFNSSNYWVDAVFSASGTPASLVSIAVTPGNTSLQMGATQQFVATGRYSDGTTFDISNSVSWASSNPAVVTLSSSGMARAMSAGSASIVATLAGVSGNTTLTVPTPPPQGSEGPGGPILVVSSSGNPFSRYCAEILRAEGFDEFTAMDLANVTSSILAGYDLVLLGDIPLTSGQAQMFTSWVTGGGRLIALHPDKQLASVLGLTAAAGTLSEGYILVNTSSGPGAGIVGQTMQFHGSADRYTLTGATSIATLYSNASVPTSNPAITLTSAGLGQAAAFTYDLARSVIYTRQGNPAWSGERRDGSTDVTRSDNLFFGAAAFDPQPNWVDLSKVAIPQADEQQRLLANLIIQMNLARRPLPRFWYLPSGFKATVVMTGDDHAIGGTAGRFDDYIANSPTGCSVADWQCVRSTSYIYPNAPLTSTQANSYTSQGFEVALHVNTNCQDWTSSADLDSDYATQLTTFRSKYTGIPAPSTNRTHCIAWSDYDTQPKVELAHGIRLDTTYYYWPPAWVNDVPGLFTGSGIPMRFADMFGQTIDVYQATTQLTDESGQTYPKNIDTLLNNATGPLGYYGVFTANMHTDQVASTGSDAIVASAQARGVPIVSSLQMLRWLDGRNGSSFGSITWNGNVLGFSVSAASAARNLQTMLPVNAGSGTLRTITRSGTTVTFSTQTIKGIAYAFFPSTTGAYQATYQ